MLEVIARENLQRNAADVGAYLAERLAALRAKHPIMTQVRGKGLFIAVELSAADRSPATAKAREVINALARSGVLVGLTGPASNILKIRPPLVFSKENSDMLVEKLDAVLGALTAA